MFRVSRGSTGVILHLRTVVLLPARLPPSKWRMADKLEAGFAKLCDQFAVPSIVREIGLRHPGLPGFSLWWCLHHHGVWLCLSLCPRLPWLVSSRLAWVSTLGLKACFIPSPLGGCMQPSLRCCLGGGAGWALPIGAALPCNTTVVVTE